VTDELAVARARRLGEVGRAVGGARFRVELGDRVRFEPTGQASRVQGLMFDVGSDEPTRMLALVELGDRGWWWVPTQDCEVLQQWSQEQRS
jgi:hypothetical protein